MSLKQDVADMESALKTAATVTTKRAASNISAPAAMLKLSSGYKGLQAEVEELRKGVGQPMRVRLELCDDGPHHTSPLDLARVAKLRANLEQNPQSSPALLRPKEGGRFEIIAGRHRKAALLALGREDWDAVLKDIDDDSAERLTFYDNLLAPNLTDFAKYRGFAARRQSKGYTIQQLAAESGVGEKVVTALFSFERLAPEMMLVAEESPDRISYTLVQAVLPYVESKPDRVVAALKLVASNADATHAQAMAHITKPEQTQAPIRQAPIVVKSGKKVYAELTRREGRLVVTLKSTDSAEAAKVEARIHQVLKEMSTSQNG